MNYLIYECGFVEVGIQTLKHEKILLISKVIIRQWQLLRERLILCKVLIVCNILNLMNYLIFESDFLDVGFAPHKEIY